MDWSPLAQELILKHVIEVKIEGRVEVAGRQGRGHKQLLDGLKETTGYSKLKQEALYRTVWITRFGRGLWTCPKTTE